MTGEVINKIDLTGLDQAEITQLQQQFGKK